MQRTPGPGVKETHAKNEAEIEVEAFELGAEHVIEIEVLTKAKLVSRILPARVNLRFVCSIDFGLGERA